MSKLPTCAAESELSRSRPGITGEATAIEVDNDKIKTKINIKLDLVTFEPQEKKVANRIAMVFQTTVLHRDILVCIHQLRPVAPHCLRWTVIDETTLLMMMANAAGLFFGSPTAS